MVCPNFSAFRISVFFGSWSNSPLNWCRIPATWRRLITIWTFGFWLNSKSYSTAALTFTEFRIRVTSSPYTCMKTSYNCPVSQTGFRNPTATKGCEYPQPGHGIQARRGDGTFGEIIPGQVPVVQPGFAVARGTIATLEIGVEVKILAKAMIKQIDRVINDLCNQVVQFRKGGGTPLGFGESSGSIKLQNMSASKAKTAVIQPLVESGAPQYPSQEAAEAEKRLRELAAPSFEEFLILPFRATNEPPFPFEWVGFERTRLDYAAASSLESSSKYQQRF